MEKKNMVLLTVIAVATLLVAVVGATFAYFTATVTNNYDGTGENGNTNISAAKVASTMTFASTSDNAGKFTAENVYPGHKEVAEIKVSATGTDEGAQAAIRIAYSTTTNDFGADAIKLSVYRSDSQIELGDNKNFFKCVQKSGTATEMGQTKLYEECDNVAEKLENASQIGTTKSAPQSQGTVNLVDRDTITSGNGTKDVFYYVVVEFVDTGSGDQNGEMGHSLEGNIQITAA